ncbi:hypothetical protein NDU88_008267 [Pleurodeles waltl]|uniref:Uncharacterized protein n=1 Tax=Pleurodeles waltl TaxID=8319 RepID=A0AAV7QQ89_PLEWA|nr:hypothetical protein NDU88_008267 [Pleurodeles waltl]
MTWKQGGELQPGEGEQLEHRGELRLGDGEPLEHGGKLRPGDREPREHGGELWPGYSEPLQHGGESRPGDGFTEDPGRWRGRRNAGAVHILGITWPDQKRRRDGTGRTRKQGGELQPGEGEPLEHRGEFWPGDGEPPEHGGELWPGDREPREHGRELWPGDVSLCSMVESRSQETELRRTHEKKEGEDVLEPTTF